MKEDAGIPRALYLRRKLAAPRRKSGPTGFVQNPMTNED